MLQHERMHADLVVQKALGITHLDHLKWEVVWDSIHGMSIYKVHPPNDTLTSESAFLQQENNLM